jgi:putative acetyltransferase
VSDILIVEASSAEAYQIARALIVEYRDMALAEDYAIGAAGLNEELAQFPGPYRPPNGCLLIAYTGGRPCGCVALRPIDERRGEVMRMYVKPQARGKGIAEMLVRNLIARGRDMGYQALYLDSLQRFTAAHRLYEKLGFAYCQPYDPATTAAMRESMVFMKLDLHP